MKIKCVKCGLRYKDRKDPEETPTEKILCWNCRFVWKCLGMMIQHWPPRINRVVTINFDHVSIVKKNEKL